MFKNTREKIENKRNSKNLIWRISVWLKDVGWRLFSFHPSRTKTVRKAKYALFDHDFTDLDVIKPIKKFAFVFICQSGELEIKALLLATSLKRHLKCDYELIAVIPEPEEIMGRPQDLTIQVLKSMGVRVTKICNEMIKGSSRTKEYFNANRMYCFRIPVSADKFIFLDSDLLCQKDVFNDPRFVIPFNASFVGMSGSIHYQGLWGKFYKAVGTEIPFPRIRKIVKEGNKEIIYYVPPAFRGCFVSIKASLASSLADCWFECFKKLEDEKLVKNYHYHIGQVALTLAVHKLKIPYEILDPWLNDHFIHCVKSKNIEENQTWAPLAKSLIIDYPQIAELIKDNNDWNFLLKND